MGMRSGLIIGTAALAAMLAQAQDGNVAGPTAGFVFDSAARALRPVEGIPGSALVGDALQLDYAVSSAYFSPRQDAALTVADDNSVHFLRIRSGAVSERTVEGLGGKPDRVVFSPRGSAALLVSGGHLTVLNGLPDAPAVSASLDLDDSSYSLAISDDAAYLLAAGHGSVRLLGAASGENFKLTDTGDGAIAAFAPGSYDAAIADSSGAGLLLFRNAKRGGDPAVVSSSDESIASPVGLAFSDNGRKLFLASSSARAVASFDLEAGDRGTIACNCTPAALVRMGTAFRLNELGSEPLWLFDPGTTEARIVFVPVLRAE
jgi:hypothetical protein